MTRPHKQVTPQILCRPELYYSTHLKGQEPLRRRIKSQHHTTGKLCCFSGIREGGVVCLGPSGTSWRGHGCALQNFALSQSVLPLASQSHSADLRNQSYHIIFDLPFGFSYKAENLQVNRLFRLTNSGAYAGGKCCQIYLRKLSRYTQMLSE